ncbi:hypothetical protein [Streptomyces scopuliridis]|uniref:hypothetical protein n=1 Tax=Streptomyces scopuliridis TaxID=452529 RepID=UPI0036B98842
MPESEVVLAPAELRAALEADLARIDGQLALLVQRSDQIDKTVEELERRVAALEKTRWPIPMIAVLSSIASTALGAVTIAEMSWTGSCGAATLWSGFHRLRNRQDSAPSLSDRRERCTVETITVGIHRHRRSLLLITVGLIILLLHGIVYAQETSGLSSMPIDTSPEGLDQFNEQLAGQQGAFTRLFAAATVLPLVGQALITAGLLGWVLHRRTSTQS